jgi:hypothetical protein
MAITYQSVLTYADNVDALNADYYIKENLPDISYSNWAKDSIEKSIELGLVPENLQSNYTHKITRAEFCQLAVQTYISKTGNSIDINDKTPFTDVDNYYITSAYNLNIVTGVGNNKFAPDNNITRQEAAVMLNNLANVLNINKSTTSTCKFVDEGYFADWAKVAIYSVAGMKSGDTYVMAGTGNNKFSPWMNYTREQAIATMYRLYTCDAYTEIPISDEADDGYIYFELNSDDNSYKLLKLSNSGNELQQLLSSTEKIDIVSTTDNYIYYQSQSNSEMTLSRIKKDGTDNKTIVKANNIRSFYIGEKNIYYISENAEAATSYIAKSDLNGENTVSCNLPANRSASIISEADNKIYILLTPTEQAKPNSLIYEYNFDTAQFKQIDSIDTDMFSGKAISDGKNIYTKIAKIVGEAQPYEVYYIYVCDANGNNAKPFYIMNLDSREKPFVYNDFIYTTASEDGTNIIKINKNGEAEKVTNYNNYGRKITILKIYDNTVYYYTKSDTDAQICTISTDGANNQAILDF